MALGSKVPATPSLEFAGTLVSMMGVIDTLQPNGFRVSIYNFFIIYIYIYIYS